MDTLQISPFSFSERETSKLIIKHETYGLITPELCLETLREFQSKTWYRSTAEIGRTITPIKTGLASFQDSVLTIHVTGTIYVTSLYFVSLSLVKIGHLAVHPWGWHKDHICDLHTGSRVIPTNEHSVQF